MKTTATNRKIRVLLRALETRSLIPNPTFQRRLVWSSKHKIAFLDTVLRRYPFPEIYIASGSVDAETAEGTEMLVDGQQRITTLQEYFRGSRDLPYSLEVPPYSSLDLSDKTAFLEYEVVVRDMGTVDMQELREVFQRINSTKYALNAMEIQNARYGGAFKEFGDQLASHPFFEQHHVFSTIDIRRMHDIRMVLTLAATVLEGYFNRDRMVEEYLSTFNDSFPMAPFIWANLERVFRFVDACDFPLECRVWNKADLFTLLVEVYAHIERNDIPPDHETVGLRLFEFYEKVNDDRSRMDPLVGIYYKAAVQATNDRSSRITRGEVVRMIIYSDQ